MTEDARLVDLLEQAAAQSTKLGHVALATQLQGLAQTVAAFPSPSGSEEEALPQALTTPFSFADMMPAVHTSGRLAATLRGRALAHADERVSYQQFMESFTTYPSSLAKMGVELFLARHPDLFCGVGSPRTSANATSRQWHLAASFMQANFSDAVGDPTIVEGLPRLRNGLIECLGEETGTACAAFIANLLRTAGPLAREQLAAPTPNRARLKKEIGNGVSNADQRFVYQYAAALAYYAVEAVVAKDLSVPGSLEAAVQPLGKNLDIFGDEEMDRCVQMFSTRLAHALHTQTSNNDDRPALTRSTKIEIAQGLIEGMAQVGGEARNHVIVGALAEKNGHNGPSRAAP